MSQEEREVINACIALLKATLGQGINSAKADEIVNSVVEILRTL